MSRDSALTEDVSRGILAAIRAGNDNVVAAGAQGISETTLYRWIERGADDAVCVKRFAPSAAHPSGKVEWSACPAQDHEPGTCPGNERYRAFRDALDQARHEFEVMMSGHVAKAAPTDPRYALALLERRVPERWKASRPIVPADASRHGGVPFTMTLIEENRKESEVREIMGDKYVPPAWIQARVPGMSDTRPPCDECHELLVWVPTEPEGTGYWVCRRDDRHASGQPHAFTTLNTVVRQPPPQATAS